MYFCTIWFNFVVWGKILSVSQNYGLFLQHYWFCRNCKNTWNACNSTVFQLSEFHTIFTALSWILSIWFVKIMSNCVGLSCNFISINPIYSDPLTDIQTWHTHIHIHIHIHIYTLLEPDKSLFERLVYLFDVFFRDFLKTNTFKFKFPLGVLETKCFVLFVFSVVFATCSCLGSGGAWPNKWNEPNGSMSNYDGLRTQDFKQSPEMNRRFPKMTWN